MPSNGGHGLLGLIEEITEARDTAFSIQLLRAALLGAARLPRKSARLAIVSIVDSDEGRVPRRLVGQGGSTLDAFQELTRLAVQSATGERSRLMLDIAGHRAERKAALIELAKEAIAKVKDGSEREALSPMTAFERKVVHDEVLAAGLVSESEGAEPRRFVVVLPA